MTMRERAVATLDQIPAGEGRVFLIDGKEIAVFHTHDGSAYATQAHCPHRNGPLADGLLGGATVVCPLHDRTYDLKTGCGLSHERATIAAYPTRVAQDGRIWLDPVPLPSPAPAPAS